MTPSLSSRAHLLVEGATLQGRYSGYGLTVERSDGGYWVTGTGRLYAHSADDARRTVERLLTQRADESADAAPVRRYRPHPGDGEARVVATSGVQL